MKKNIIFMGPLFQEKNIESIKNRVKKGFNIAPNLLQWNIIKGIFDNTGNNITIINALPVGIWPIEYNEIVLKDSHWKNGSADCYELGCLNFPFIKQKARSIKAKKILNKICKDEDVVIIYSTYLPFLDAVFKIKKKITTILIVADLPEYYDNGKASVLKKIFRHFQNKKIYENIKKINSFVLLTDLMKNPLKVGNRPYVVMEGICDSVIPEDNCVLEKNKVIFMYAGALLNKYGLKELMDTFTGIDNKNLELWICGDGDDKNSVIDAAKKDNRIIYYGYCNQARLKELMSMCDSLVNPRKPIEEYTKYSFPSKTMEYLLSGKVVVMYKLPGIPLEYYDYVIGIDNSDDNSLRDALLRVIKMTKEERKQFGKKSQEFVILEKNRKKQTKKILDLLDYNV